MTNFKYINENLDNVKELARRGMLPLTVLNYIIIYSRYEQYRKRGEYVCVAVLYTSEDYKVSERTVYKAIKVMSEEL